MTNFKWLNLQLFGGEGASGASSGGEGNGASAGEGAATGVNTVDAEQQRLRELGVPEDKLRRRAQRPTAKKLPDNTGNNVQQASEQVAAAEVNPTEEGKANTSTRMSWDEIMADPEYNKQMQSVVQSRLKSAKGAEEALSKLTPALEVLARKHNIDPANMDYDALAKAIGDDSGYYEDRALEMGVPVETAKKIDQQERDIARQQRTLEEQKIANHLAGLEQQGEAMKKVFPNFDLRTELKNPAFTRMTSPNVGISVEDAYYAVHRNEIQAAAMQVTAQKTAQKISNAIQAGSRRPDEAGISSQAPSVTQFDYRNASREQREALKQRIREAAARGEKVYPGK